MRRQVYTYFQTIATTGQIQVPPGRIVKAWATVSLTHTAAATATLNLALQSGFAGSNWQLDNVVLIELPLCIDNAGQIALATERDLDILLPVSSVVYANTFLSAGTCKFEAAFLFEPR